MMLDEIQKCTLWRHKESGDTILVQGIKDDQVYFANESKAERITSEILNADEKDDAIIAMSIKDIVSVAYCEFVLPVETFLQEHEIIEQPTVLKDTGYPAVAQGGFAV